MFSISTLVVGFVVVGVCVAIIASSIIKRKNGKNSCSYGCGSCPMSDTCHKKNDNNQFNG